MTQTFTRLAAIACCALVAACASSRTLSGSINEIGAGAELKAMLFTDRSYDYSDVDLTMYEGRLLLTGSMRTETGRKKLVESAWKADGVTQVIDEIVISEHTSFGQGLEDTRIDQSIRARFLTAGDIRNANYKIAVSDGVVYLLGVARDEDELNGALEIARTMSGVKAVVSHVLYRTPAAGPNR